MQQDLPAFLRWSTTSPGSVCNHKVEEARLFIHMDFAYQEFLLHRILWKRLGRKSEGLFETSCEVISTLLDIATLMTKSGRPLRSLSWDVGISIPTLDLLLGTFADSKFYII